MALVAGPTRAAFLVLTASARPREAPASGASQSRTERPFTCSISPPGPSHRGDRGAARRASASLHAAGACGLLPELPPGPPRRARRCRQRVRQDQDGGIDACFSELWFENPGPLGSARSSSRPVSRRGGRVAGKAPRDPPRGRRRHDGGRYLADNGARSGGGRLRGVAPRRVSPRGRPATDGRLDPAHPRIRVGWGVIGSRGRRLRPRTSPSSGG